MNEIASVAPLVAILLSLVYVILSLIAFGHIREDKATGYFSRYMAINLWWPFYDLYDDSMKNVCLSGKIILALTTISYVVWLSG